MSESQHRRPYGSTVQHVMLQGRVMPETREAAKKRADKLGMSMAAYLEELVRYDAEHEVVTVPHPPYSQEQISA